MSKWSRSLIEYGFVKSEHAHKYPVDSDTGRRKVAEDAKEDDLSDHADEEYMELRQGQSHDPTGYPSSDWNYRLVYETFQASIEAVYFWVVDTLKHGPGGVMIDKVIDAFSATEHSTFFGVAQQRVGLQQDKVSQFMATIGKMVKDLFQLVRELRILDERLELYNDSYTKSDSAKSAEITLKGIWVDLVEQGAKNPASVYGMARELGFATLPDLFFDARPMEPEEVDSEVAKLDFNRKVREVLARKLRTYLQWKKSTHSELKSKRKFTLQYLRQHYEVINMYMVWVRPYLRNIERLNLRDDTENPNLISAFEQSLVEIEILAKKDPQGPYHPVILINFEYRTRPSMDYQAEGYQRAPIHVGQITINWKSYAWTKEKIQAYKDYRRAEDFKLLGIIDGQVKAAMEALGTELEGYLKEAGKVYEKKEDAAKKETKINIGDSPFLAVFKGFGELFGPLMPKISGGKKENHFELYKQKKEALGIAKKSMWNIYKIFKKNRRMLGW